MVFSSVLFLTVFLPVFLLVFYLIDRPYKKLVILLFSTVFYAWGAPKFIFFLLGSSIIDFFISKKLEPGSKNRKLFLWFSLALNVLLLVYFKYANFFVDNISSLSESFGMDTISIKEVLLPIGISFFTFQKISYMMDVYSGNNKRLKSFVDYLIYIIIFPQLIAGPIVRFKDVSEQIRAFDKNKFDDRLEGLFRFTIGLSKKVFIANTFAEIVSNTQLIGLENYTTGDAWTSILAYTFQIYYDFAGYSDMAIGLGLMIGFRFPENFNFPYLSKSITEFWQRWHITLGSWMRDYLYIPLGGNRVAKHRIYINLMIVFFISGFWHGASWNFIVWGVFHGFFLMIERAGLGKILQKLPTPISIAYTFFTVIIGWVFFSMEMNEASLFLKKMFAFDSWSVTKEIESSKILLITTIGVLCAFMGINKKTRQFFNELPAKLTNGLKLHLIITYPIVVACLLLALISLMTDDFNPFIYYRF